MTAQHPIGSGFPPSSTAADVVAGIDLRGKNVIVTAGHTGLGLETTRALANAGATVTVAARDVEKASAAVVSLAPVSQLDLLDPASIRAFADRWGERPLHILINCAAAPGSPTRIVDARGFERHFATTHLGHFALTLALIPALRAAHGARVVTVSSGAHRFGQIRWDDPNFETGYQPQVAYAQAKKANVLFSVELDRRYAAAGIRAYAVHPGVVVGTVLNASAGTDALRAMGLIDEAGAPIIDPVVGKKTVQQGASTIAFAATSPLLANIGGVYLKDNDVSRIDDEQRPLTSTSIPSEACSSSLDPAAARRLWELSEKLLGVTAS
ncbi:MAG TPA: SDR family NAD(P)-dependent oxidoreductase [Kofleriaceae bacterium]|jgi:NAD(P)-dependent dehydrogenase (short-subunit alcohol dehydrogenase family)